MSATALAIARALVEAEAAFSVSVAVADDTVAAAAAMARAYAAGVRLRLGRNGRVEMQAPRQPPADVVEELRRCRDAVRRLLVGKALPPAARQRFRSRGGGA